MKILITGSNGLLGQKLIEQLSQSSTHTVVAIGRGPSRLPRGTKNIIYEDCDITDLKRTTEIFRDHHPDTVIHAAAMTNVDDCELNPSTCFLHNVEATKNIIKAAESNSCHIIHLSTDFIFDGKDGPYNEEAKPNPISIYGKSKLEAEQLIQQSNTKWAIVRTVLVYGVAPGLSRSNIILWVKESLEQGKAIQVVTDQYRTPTLAEDLATGCLLIAEKQATGIFNVSGEQLLTPYEMAVRTAEHFNLDGSLIKVASSETFSQPAKRPLRTGFDISKAKKILGYSPHSFEDGIRKIASQITN